MHNATTLMDEFGLQHLPYYNTEFGTTSRQGDGCADFPDTDVHDTHEQASFIVAAVAQLAAATQQNGSFRLPTTLSYWTFSDIMNEESPASGCVIVTSLICRCIPCLVLIPIIHARTRAHMITPNTACAG